MNGDARPDLYIRSRHVAVVPVDDIPVVIGPAVRDFVLQSRADGSFDLINTLTAAQRSAGSQWASADVTLVFRDVDMDGRGDLDLLSVGNAVPGARDLIVLSGARGAAPKQLIVKNNKFMNFHNDLVAAIQDPQYFDNYAVNRVVSSEPPSRIYYGGIINAGSFAATSSLLAMCRADFPNHVCNVTTVDPAQCVWTQNLYNSNGEYVGTVTRNVCGDHLNVFVYVPGSVQVVKDYSVFDQHARETKEILDRLQNGCGLFQPSADTQRITEILGGIYGLPSLISDRYTPNSVPHPPAPGDELYDQDDPTFHHYDARSKLCTVGEPNCNLVAASSYSYRGLRAFTYPAQRLEPMYTPVDGSQHTVYVVPYYKPWAADRPQEYTWPFGVITQRFVQSGYWAEGVQNVTTPQHWVYPGTIVRKMFQEGNSLYVRTHGMGVNRFWCAPANPADPASYGVLGVRMIIAFSNDHFGPVMFRTMDNEMRRHWRLQNGYSAAAAAAATSAAGTDAVAGRNGGSPNQ